MSVVGADSDLTIQSYCLMMSVDVSAATCATSLSTPSATDRCFLDSIERTSATLTSAKPSETLSGSASSTASAWSRALTMAERQSGTLKAPAAAILALSAATVSSTSTLRKAT